jgi:phosphoglycolate phosphatase
MFVGGIVRFHAIIFDLDGTLVNSLDDLADATNIVLADSGFGTHPVYAFRYFVGDGFYPLVQRALPENRRDPVTIERLVEALSVEYAGRMTRKTRPYPGIRKLLNACVSSGLKAAVLTNKPDGAAKEVVTQLLPDTAFDRVLGTGVGFPKKPDPAGALCLAGDLGADPGQCVFIGDSAVDMETAVASGMFALGALWGFRTAEELLEAGARMLAKSPLDVVPWIQAA